MTKRLDHEAATKLARVSRGRGESIEHGDRTLHRSGYPSAQDMANSPPHRRNPKLDITPLTYKQEPIDVAVREARRLSAENTAAKARLKEERRAAAERRKNLAAPVIRLGGSRPAQAATNGPAAYTVKQSFPRAPESRSVLVEVKPATSPTKPRLGKLDRKP